MNTITFYIKTGSAPSPLWCVWWILAMSTLKTFRPVRFLAREQAELTPSPWILMKPDNNIRYDSRRRRWRRTQRGCEELYTRQLTRLCCIQMPRH
ncbi:large ribosomal subunit protein eL39-like [Saccopteryx bilineata]|uniref:large ribosomal subunit protein eL39-like n=1 Tax=Saccopteryx bilineata TaxID=59482 RepID=UPI00338EF0C0